MGEAFVVLQSIFVAYRQSSLFLQPRLGIAKSPVFEETGLLHK
jgi:hypothetical protein